MRDWLEGRRGRSRQRWNRRLFGRGVGKRPRSISTCELRPRSSNHTDLPPLLTRGLASRFSPESDPSHTGSASPVESLDHQARLAGVGVFGGRAVFPLDGHACPPPGADQSGCRPRAWRWPAAAPGRSRRARPGRRWKCGSSAAGNRVQTRLTSSVDSGSSEEVHGLVVTATPVRFGASAAPGWRTRVRAAAVLARAGTVPTVMR